jgi:pimeloyl-ACP methyl ester carboxylesterase
MTHFIFMKTEQLELECEHSHRGSFLKSALLWTGAAVGTLAAVNAFIAARTPPLQNALPGTFHRFPGRAGDVAYVVAGSGSPVLLLHGVGAGNSMLEWEKNFEALREHHTVYALDLLGFGRSDRPEYKYSCGDYADLVVTFLRNVINEPCALIASSDSCNFAIEAANRAPELVSKLVLICPPTLPDEGEGRQAERHFLWKLFSLPVLGQTIHNFFTSRAAIRRFSESELFYDKTLVTEEFITRHHVDAHQKGARWGVASFVSGWMRRDAHRTWEKLSQPALLIWGRNARISGIETAPEWLALKTDAQLEVVDRAMLMPHFERPEEWNTVVLNWLNPNGSDE